MPDLDRVVVSAAHAQELGLPARHRTVELRVPVEGGTGPLLAVLRDVALGRQPRVAHLAVSAGDHKRHNNSIPNCEFRHAVAHFFDDAHRLVAKDVAPREERPEHAVEVQVGPANRGRRDPDDHIPRILDGGPGDRRNFDLAVRLPRHCAHGSSSRRGMIP